MVQRNASSLQGKRPSLSLPPARGAAQGRDSPEVPSDAPGFWAAGGEEGRESGTVRPPRTSGRLQTAESNECRVKKRDRESCEVRIAPSADPERERSQVSSNVRGDKKREARGAAGTEQKSRKEGRGSRPNAGSRISEKPGKEGGQRRLTVLHIPEF